MTLTRQRLTWLLYAATVAWASFVYLLGPSTALLAEDFRLDPRQAGLYVTALAVDIISRGSVNSRVTARAGRPLAFRLGLLGLLSGVAVLALAPAYLLSLAAVWLAGFGGALVFATTTATPSELHGEDGAAAITEANAGAAWIGAVSPQVLGEVRPPGWLAGGPPLCVLIVGVTFVVSLRLPGSTRRSTGTAAAGLTAPRRIVSRLFALTCVALFCAVGTEFAVNFWGATLLRDLMAAAAATAAMSAVVIGLAVGPPPAPGCRCAWTPMPSCSAGSCSPQSDSWRSGSPAWWPWRSSGCSSLAWALHPVPLHPRPNRVELGWAA